MGVGYPNINKEKSKKLSKFIIDNTKLIHDAQVHENGRL